MSDSSEKDDTVTDSPVTDSPVVGGPVVGGPVVGGPGVGGPVVGGPVVGSPVVGSPAVGSPVAGNTVEGSTAPGFEAVAEEFGRLLAQERDARGQFCAYLRGQRVAHLWGGDGIEPDDLQGVFSSTKGVSATCIALLVQRGALDLDAPVSRYWPEF